MTKHKKYQDYVIKNGKLIGDFERMYQDFDDPWEQTTRETYAIEKAATLEIIKEKKFKRVLEYGCGFGDFASRIGLVSDNILGVDISKTAIEKAKNKYPSIDFKIGDILDFNILEEYQPDCIIFAEISWYVLGKLPEFKQYLKSNCGGVGLVHLLMTYPKNEQQYGKDYFSNLSEIMQYWDIVDFEKWGEFSTKEYNGGKRTLCFGLIK